MFRPALPFVPADPLDPVVVQLRDFVADRYSNPLRMSEDDKVVVCFHINSCDNMSCPWDGTNIDNQLHLWRDLRLRFPQQAPHIRLHIEAYENLSSRDDPGVNNFVPRGIDWIYEMAEGFHREEITIERLRPAHDIHADNWEFFLWYRKECEVVAGTITFTVPDFIVGRYTTVRT
jgi:hypothetical protein